MSYGGCVGAVGARHKVDPDKALHDGDTYAGIADTGTDAIIIGGTTNVTEARVQPILDALSSTEIPIFVEPTYRPRSLIPRHSLGTYFRSF